MQGFTRAPPARRWRHAGIGGGTANRSRGSSEEQTPAAAVVAEELGSGLRGAWELQAGLKADVWFLELPLLRLGGR